MLEKYQDFDTNPSNEPLEKVKARLEQTFTYYYFICLDDRKVGAIRVVDKKESPHKRISPLFILPEYRNKGIAQQEILLCEEICTKILRKLKMWSYRVRLAVGEMN